MTCQPLSGCHLSQSWTLRRTLLLLHLQYQAGFSILDVYTSHVQSGVVAKTLLVPSKSVVVSWLSCYTCAAMSCQDRACP